MEDILTIDDDDVEMCVRSRNNFNRKDSKSKPSTTPKTVLNEHCRGNTLVFYSKSCSRRSIEMKVDTFAEVWVASECSKPCRVSMGAGI